MLFTFAGSFGHYLPCMVPQVEAGNLSRMQRGYNAPDGCIRRNIHHCTDWPARELDFVWRSLNDARRKRDILLVLRVYAVRVGKVGEGDAQGAQFPGDRHYADHPEVFDGAKDF